MYILLLDDDVSCMDGLLTALEPAGHRCDIYSVPEEAVKAYEEDRHDVVITDMRMPGMNGIEVLKEVLSIDKGARVIIVTGYGDVETAIAAVNNRAYAFFGKPLDISDLMETLDKIEMEMGEQKRIGSEHARMTEELHRLRRVYDELRLLIVEHDAGSGQGR